MSTPEATQTAILTTEQADQIADLARSYRNLAAEACLAEDTRMSALFEQSSAVFAELLDLLSQPLAIRATK